jgi:hypothetical protein
MGTLYVVAGANRQGLHRVVRVTLDGETELIQARGWALRTIARLCSRRVQRGHHSVRPRPSLFQLALGSSTFLKAKMPPALIHASKSLRWKRRPLPTLTLAGAIRSLT